MRITCHGGALLQNLDSLRQNLLDPLLDDLGSFFLFACVFPAIRVLVGPDLCAPSIPFVDETLAVGDQLLAGTALLGCVLLVEYTPKVLELLDDCLLLLLGQQSLWARPPQELLEPVQNVLLQLLALEVPNSVAVFELMTASSNTRIETCDTKRDSHYASRHSRWWR